MLPQCPGFPLSPRQHHVGSIYVPKYDAGDRVKINVRSATVLRNGSAEGTVVIRFDDCPDDEEFAHERFLSPLATPGPTPTPITGPRVSEHSGCKPTPRA
jgi:hypothetical protein